MVDINNTYSLFILREVYKQATFTSLGSSTLCWNPRRLGATDGRGLCWYSLRSIISATANIYLYGYWSKPWHLVNPKIAGKWMFIPLEVITIGFDPPPYTKTWKTIIHSSKSDYLELYTKYWPWPFFLAMAIDERWFQHIKQPVKQPVFIDSSRRWTERHPNSSSSGGSTVLPMPSEKVHWINGATKTWSKPPKITGFSAEVFLCFLGWFGTFFIFHNIWDNLSHWLKFFKLVKPPTSRSLDLVIGQNWGCTTWLILMTYSGSMLMQVKLFVETFKIRQECESTDAISHPYGFLVYSNYLLLFFGMVYCLYLDVFSLVCLAEGLRKWSHGSYDALKLGMWSSILVIRTHNRNASN